VVIVNYCTGAKKKLHMFAEDTSNGESDWKWPLETLVHDQDVVRNCELAVTMMTSIDRGAFEAMLEQVAPFLEFVSLDVAIPKLLQAGPTEYEKIVGELSDLAKQNELVQSQQANPPCFVQTTIVPARSVASVTALSDAMHQLVQCLPSKWQQSLDPHGLVRPRAPDVVEIKIHLKDANRILTLTLSRLNATMTCKVETGRSGRGEQWEVDVRKCECGALFTLCNARHVSWQPLKPKQPITKVKIGSNGVCVGEVMVFDIPLFRVGHSGNYAVVQTEDGRKLACHASLFEKKDNIFPLEDHLKNFLGHGFKWNAKPAHVKVLKSYYFSGENSEDTVVIDGVGFERNTIVFGSTFQIVSSGGDSWTVQSEESTNILVDKSSCIIKNTKLPPPGVWLEKLPPPIIQSWTKQDALSKFRHVFKELNNDWNGINMAHVIGGIAYIGFHLPSYTGAAPANVRVAISEGHD
jgi:hypothetical protein